MNKNQRFTTTTALIVALGGFLMGFDASVISGVVTFIEPEFDLDKIELGWAVASLTLTATLAMMVAGPLSDRIGRKPVLRIAAVVFAISAIASALATSFTALVVARMIGGLGVGAALIIAPMYIAEISPPAHRGRLVSFNQLNIVIGISVAFFTNYVILQLSQSQASWALALHLEEWNWRWMLGLETLPAVLYFFCLYLVPESPRWLVMNNKEDEAFNILCKVSDATQAQKDIEVIRSSVRTDGDKDIEQSTLGDLFKKPMRLVLAIGLTVAVLQQITGINSVFFYAPMIFEQSGIGTNASFMQAILVGLTNLVFTLIAMTLIDRLGRKPILVFGVSGIAVFMFLLAYGFDAATYTLSADAIAGLSSGIDQTLLLQIQDITFTSDVGFKQAVAEVLGQGSWQNFESELISAAITMNPTLILIGILGFVASFAISIGPVMWVLFAELFPNRIRGIAISFVGLVNSGVSFLVQLVFPWELANIGNAGAFFIYGLFAVIGLLIIARLLPETKGRSLEEIEELLVAA
ncbi:MAG: sugar porter family MFS transporter [Halioglobus sp.]